MPPAMEGFGFPGLYIVTLFVIFIGIVFHAPLSVGLGVLLPDYELFIKAWKEILMLLLIPLAILIITRHRLWNELLKDWIFRIIIFYALLHVVMIIAQWQGLEPTLAGLTIDLRYLLFFGLCYVGVRAIPQARQLLILAATIGAFVVVGFATLQLFLPPDILVHIGYSQETIAPYLTVDKNPDYIRVNSTLRGPNPLGAYAGMVLGILAAALTKTKLHFKDKRVLTATTFLAICATTALWISYSRSALVAAIAAVLIVVASAAVRKVSRRAWIASAVLLFALAGGLLAARESSFVSNVLLHENPVGGSQVSSNEDHLESLQYGITQALQEPLGSGVGSTGSASLFGPNPVIVENQYLFIVHEVGWLGLGLFVTLFGLLMIRLWRARQDWLALGVFASGIGLSLIGLLLPVWVDDTVAIVWWGLAAVALAGGKYARNTTK